MQKLAANDVVRPLDLSLIARSIAANYGDKGAVVITLNSKGVRIGAEGLTPEELRQALRLGIDYSFEFTIAAGAAASSV